jgi:hypothetical protein
MQKTTTTCDICALTLTVEECSTPLRIGDKIYDVCASCHEKLMAQLEGKGRPVVDPQIVPFPYPMVPPVLVPWPPPVPVVPLPSIPGMPYIGDPIQPQYPIICGTNVCEGSSSANTR